METGFILLFSFIHILVYLVFFIFIFILLGIYLIIRKGILIRLIENLKSKQVEEFQRQTSVNMAKVHDKLNANTSQITETEKQLMTLINEMQTLTENNNKIISKIEQIASANSESNEQLIITIEKSFEKEFFRLQEFIKANKQPSIAKIPESKPKPILRQEPIQKSNQLGSDTYFMPFPDPKGFFWNDNKHKVSKNNSAFKMNIMQNNTKKAYFSLLTDNKTIIKNALLNPKAYLKPVCEIVGNISGTSITIIENGELELKNNKWVVSENKKIKIKVTQRY